MARFGFFLLSPFAKGGGKKAYSNSIHYDHSSTLKTFQEIFQVGPLLGAAGNPKPRISATFSGTTAKDAGTENGSSKTARACTTDKRGSGLA